MSMTFSSGVVSCDVIQFNNDEKKNEKGKTKRKKGTGGADGTRKKVKWIIECTNSEVDRETSRSRRNQISRRGSGKRGAEADGGRERREREGGEREREREKKAAFAVLLCVCVFLLCICLVPHNDSAYLCSAFLFSAHADRLSVIVAFIRIVRTIVVVHPPHHLMIQ